MEHREVPVSDCAPFCPHLCLSFALSLTSSTLAFPILAAGSLKKKPEFSSDLSFCGTLGRQHGMCPRDGCNGCTFSLSWIWNNQRRHSSIHLREQKPGAKYIFWFYGCTNPQKLNGKELGRSGRWSNCFRLPAWLLLGTGYMCQFVWVI